MKNNKNLRIVITSILDTHTKQGLVELELNGRKIQLELDKARALRGMLDGAIEAAIGDTLIFAFLTQQMGLSDDAAAAALVEFRDLRQSSQSTVFPS